MHILSKPRSGYTTHSPSCSLVSDASLLTTIIYSNSPSPTTPVLALKDFMHSPSRHTELLTRSSRPPFKNNR